MTDAATSRRLAALTEWASDLPGSESRPPSRNALETIAEDNGIDRVAGDPAVIAWRPTIEWLLKQLRMGVNNPQQGVPAALSRPIAASGGSSTPPPPPPPPAPPAAVPADPQSVRLAALQQWRDESLSAGIDGAPQIKETHLRMVANSDAATEEQIRASFPPAISQFASQLAALLEPLVRPAGPGGSGEASAPANPAPAEPVPSSRPEPVTAPISTAAASHAQPAETSGETVDSTGFAPYAFGASSVVPVALTVAADGAGGLRVSWPAPPTPAIIRLVAADDVAPYSPDHARLVEATRAAHATDSEPWRHAVRQFQAWRNDGASDAEAKSSQPVLHAFGAVVAPVVGLNLREDEGRVIGQWRTLEGTTRVQIFRIPIRHARTGSGDPQFRILADGAHMGGFVDNGALAGERYLYQISAEAEVDGVARLSAPSSVEVEIPHVHQRITDLSFQLRDDLSSPAFDLHWTPPTGGLVVVYRTPRPPEAGIERGPQSESVLEQAYLTEESRLAHPIITEASAASMRDVPWPAGWTRAYFTPVVLLGGMAYVGNTVSGVRPSPVSSPKLTERVNRQVLSFEWPDGADVVLVYKSPVGVPAEAAMHGQPYEIAQGDYRDLGGMTFEHGALEPTGCDLHLVSVAFDRGRRVYGAPATITYSGILRLQYQAEVGGQFRANRFVRVSIKAVDLQLDSPPPFVLVYHPTRLPLAITDEGAIPVAVVREGDDASTPTRRFVPDSLRVEDSEARWRTDRESWGKDIKTEGGFVRLFVDLPPEVLRRVALLDPPIGTLRVQGVLGRVRGALGV